MHIGILVPMTFERAAPRHEEYTAFFKACEELGFHSIWVTDATFHRTNLFDPITVLTWAAAATTHIRIGTAVLLLALRHPALVARAAASLDVLSNGRLTLGVSLGGGDAEYAGMGIDRRQRVSRFEESVALLRRMWSGDRGKYQGRHFEFEDMTVMPVPVQSGGVPLLFGGQADAVLRRTGELADGWIEDTPGTPELFAERWEQVKQFARAAGRDPSQLESGKLFYLSVDDDPERAKITLVRHMASMYSTVSGIEDRAAFGPPEVCARRIAALAEAGVGTIMLGTPSLSITHLERISNEVLPLVGGCE